MHQKINSASFLIAITAAIACATFACESAMGAAGGVNNVPNLPAPSGAAIYKMVDASGRVTYTNSPTKGANKVELDPITVIPATPAGMLGDGQSFRQNTAKGSTQSTTQGAAQNASQPTPSAPFAAVAQFATSPLLIPVGVAPTIARPEEPSPMPAVVKTLPAQSVARLVVPANVLSAAAAAPDIRFSPATPAKPMATAVVTAIPANTASTSATKLPVVKLVPTSVAAAKVEVAANVAALPATLLVAFATTAPTFAAAATINTSAINGLPVPQLRPSASPARVISANQTARINQQEQLLAKARAQLVEEQRASESFRALRARLPAVIDQTNPAKAAIQNDIKTQVEQHFERIRNLQYQISQYEHNPPALQPINQMRALSSNAASAAVDTVASQ